MQEQINDILEEIRSLEDEQIIQIQQAAAQERIRRDTIQGARRKAEQAAQEYEEAVQDEPSKEYSPGDVIGPGDKIIEDGIEYVNTSHAWLSVPPSEYPLGFQRRETPQNARPFKAGEQVQPGDLREFQGKVYKVIQAHETADHWPPNAAHSLWTRA